MSCSDISGSPTHTHTHIHSVSHLKGYGDGAACGRWFRQGWCSVTNLLLNGVNILCICWISAAAAPVHSSRVNYSDSDASFDPEKQTCYERSSVISVMFCIMTKGKKKESYINLPSSSFNVISHFSLSSPSRRRGSVDARDGCRGRGG